jgi:hypothetical protein
VARFTNTFSRIPLSSIALASALWCAVMPAFGVGGQFGMEFAIDAPWRLEPVIVNGAATYGPVPISVSFFDTAFEEARGKVGSEGFPKIHVGRLKEVRVVEWTSGDPRPRQPSTTIRPQQFREFDRKKLVSTKSAEPAHEICKPYVQQCGAALEIGGTHEWHGVFWYTPKAAVTPGRNIHLEVTVVTEAPSSTTTTTNEWRNYLVVHAGEAPLPRFADDYLYGDFHYHAQMTDNEGESGYSYRIVARALGASGLDFVFASDHASNGVQRDGDIESKFCAGSQEGDCTEARDLNVHRYLRAKELLYGSAGINNEIGRDAETGGLARLRSAHVLPQIYLGEELDAIPEMSAAEYASSSIAFGDGQKYRWPDVSGCLGKESISHCRSTYARPVGGGYLVYDEQGIPVEETVEEYVGDGTAGDVVKWFVPDETQPAPARQHMVYFPRSSDQSAAGWIGGDTGEFGGGGKRLVNIIKEVEAGGVAFLAHPMEGDRPGGPAGPDIVPYSALQVDRAWGSESYLGLQLWNENGKRVSGPDRISPTVMHVSSDGVPPVKTYKYGWPFQEHKYGNFPWDWRSSPLPGKATTRLYHGVFTWDRYLRKGLDREQTRRLRWLQPNEPRRFFVAGGSDAHGDLNYRREGRPGLDRWTDVPVTDTAIGQPRNLVSMRRVSGQPVLTTGGGAAGNAPRRYLNRDVIDSLRAGNFSVTDGPALRVAIDRNLNGKIDDEDTQMGGVFDFYAGDPIPVLVEWKSTPEFGPIAQVDVYVGNERVTFAPKDHGAGVPPGLGQSGYGGYTPDPSRSLQVKLEDQYIRPGVRPVAPPVAYQGIVTIFIGPAQFDLVRTDKSLSYVRAFARTLIDWKAADVGICPNAQTAGSHCGSRWAYSNPVWGRYNSVCPRRSASPAGGLTAFGPLVTYIDRNSNRVPDVCEGTIQDACQRTQGPMAGNVAPRPTEAEAAGRPGPGEAAPRPTENGLPGATLGPERPIPETSCQRVAAVP